MSQIPANYSDPFLQKLRSLRFQKPILKRLLYLLGHLSHNWNLKISGEQVELISFKWWFVSSLMFYSKSLTGVLEICSPLYSNKRLKLVTHLILVNKLIRDLLFLVDSSFTKHDRGFCSFYHPNF